MTISRNLYGNLAAYIAARNQIHVVNIPNASRLHVTQTPPPPLPPTTQQPRMSGWEVRFSNSKKLAYFYNASTGQSVWEKPAELSDEQVSQLPGARQYLSGSGSSSSGGGGGKPAQVRSSHILAKHTGSRRPSSWRQVSHVSLHTCVQYTFTTIVWT
jgi:hypothetical protein